MAYFKKKNSFSGQQRHQKSPGCEFLARILFLFGSYTYFSLSRNVELTTPIYMYAWLHVYMAMEYLPVYYIHPARAPKNIPRARTRRSGLDLDIDARALMYVFRIRGGLFSPCLTQYSHPAVIFPDLDLYRSQCN